MSGVPLNNTKTEFSSTESMKKYTTGILIVLVMVLDSKKPPGYTMLPMVYTGVSYSSFWVEGYFVTPRVIKE